ncbi:MAG TPA: IS21 family transposase [Bacteroidia bacterium]|jgi:transposase|nr:IS21 family transposase [Bacteroidia bacterium]
MSNIRHILRLHTQHIAFFEIVKQTGILRATLRKHITDFKKSGLTFEEINELTDEDLEELFLKPEEKPIDIMLQKLISMFPAMNKELKRRGVTQLMLWEEYIKKHPDGYGYSRFNRYFKKWRARAIPIMHKEHKPGDKLYIDFAGQKLPITDEKTGEVKNVEVFVAILGASQLTYVEAVMTQQKEDFIPACENALQFYGGVPGAIVCDNLRSAVKKPSRYEPSINETFSDFAEHYNTAILPARVYRPTDKAPVEIAVRIIYTRIYAKLRDRTFYSLEELNRAIWLALEEHNNQAITGKECSRWQLFREMEKASLLPLPLLRYELKKQVYVTVPKNGHICLPADKHYYSVPYQVIGKKIKVLYSSESVEMFYHFERIAFYMRDRLAYTYTTVNEHLFPAYRFTSELTSDKFVLLAEGIHADVKVYIGIILDSQRHADQAYRICNGILGFAKKVGNERLTKACQRAASCGLYNYRIIKKILEQGLDMLDDESNNLKMPEHNNIRGKDYYQ